MKAPTRERAVLPQRKTATAAKLTKVTPQREIVQNLQTLLARLDTMPLPTGELGCEFLDALKLTERISEKVFAKARKLLLEQPDAIPNWHCNETSQRVLSKDTARVFETLGGKLTLKEFMGACSTSLTALRRALAERNPHLSPIEVEHVLYRALSDLVSYDSVVRLSRSKNHQLNLNLVSHESHEG